MTSPPPFASNRGPFVANGVYEQGDAVSYNGAWYVAQKPLLRAGQAPTPGTDTTAWQVYVPLAPVGPGGGLGGGGGSGTVLRGTTAARPAASAVPANSIYVATDDQGGKAYVSDGSTAWSAIAPGAQEPSAVELAYAELAAQFTITATGGVASIPSPGPLIVTFSLTVGRAVMFETLVTQPVPSSGTTPLIMQLLTGVPQGSKLLASRAFTLAGTYLPVCMLRRRLTLPAGDWLLELKLSTAGASSPNVVCYPGTDATYPEPSAWLRVVTA